MFIVNSLIEVVNHFKEISFEFVIVSKLFLPFGECPQHFKEFIQQKLVTFFLYELKILNSLIFCGVE